MAVMIRLPPVSYTHLDVYKRQKLWWTSGECSRMSFIVACTRSKWRLFASLRAIAFCIFDTDISRIALVICRVSLIACILCLISARFFIISLHSLSVRIPPAPCSRRRPRHPAAALFCMRLPAVPAFHTALPSVRLFFQYTLVYQVHK